MRVKLNAHDSVDDWRLPIVPEATAEFTLRPQSRGRFSVSARGDGFPSFELYHWNRGRVTVLCQHLGTQPLAALPPWKNKTFCRS